jgi:hypothetical protein
MVAFARAARHGAATDEERSSSMSDHAEAAADSRARRPASRSAMAAPLARKTALALALLALAACQSTEHASYLYDLQKEPPRLLDSEIRIKTYKSTRSMKPAEERVIACTNGRVTATITTDVEQGSGELSLDEYARIWAALEKRDAMQLDVDPIDPGGGYYHILHLTRGRETNEVSAQFKTNFLGFSTQEYQDRVEMVNEIALILGEAVPTTPIPKPPESRPGAAAPASAPAK